MLRLKEVNLTHRVLAVVCGILAFLAVVLAVITLRVEGFNALVAVQFMCAGACGVLALLNWSFR